MPGRPVPASHGKLSEHNVEWLQTQPPQAQMEFLLGAAINHDGGATTMIAQLVEDWHGKLHRTPRWESLQDTALYSNDCGYGPRLLKSIWPCSTSQSPTKRPIA